MTKELIALLDGKETGRVVRDNHGKLTFAYNEHWRNAGTAKRLSLAIGRANSMSPRGTRSA
jgi:serine/threonine-protein kinase HipA